jgi:WD40 repeat protein
VSSDIVFNPAGFFSLDWSPDGTRIAGGGGDDDITIWDASTGTVVNTLTGHTSVIYSVAWSPDGSKLLSGTASQNEVYVSSAGSG